MHFDAPDGDVGVIFRNVSRRSLRGLKVRSDIKTMGDFRVYHAFILGVCSLPKPYSY